MRELVECEIGGEGEVRVTAPLSAPPGGVARPRKRSGRRVSVNVAESPLSWLRSRGLVSERQYAAGERLRADYERASLSARVTMRWDAAPAATGRRGAPDAAERTLAGLSAKRRFDAAVAAAGPGLSDVLWRVVCAGEGLPAVERTLGWPARAGKLVLGLALDRVAAFYGV